LDDYTRLHVPTESLPVVCSHCRLKCSNCERGCGARARTITSFRAPSTAGCTSREQHFRSLPQFKSTIRIHQHTIQAVKQHLSLVFASSRLFTCSTNNTSAYLSILTVHRQLSAQIATLGTLGRGGVCRSFSLEQSPTPPCPPARAHPPTNHLTCDLSRWS
jgi:hypothetical protein